MQRKVKSKSILKAVLICALLPVSVAYSDESVLSLVRGKVKEQKWDLAYSSLKGLEPKKGMRLSDIEYALGRLSLDMGELKQAKKHFEKINQRKDPYKNWANFYLGLIARKESKEKQAKGKLLSLAQRKHGLRMSRGARYELARAALQTQKWREARRHLYYLERRLRGSEEYTDILWKLVKAEKASKRLWRACRWARKLYSRFPADPVVENWSVDLKNNDFEGQRLNCLPTPQDQKRRIERLQWAGLVEKARNEITWLRERAKGSAKVHADLIFANFQYRSGYVDLALELLLKHYETQKGSISYLNLLAKVAQYANEYQSAVAIHEKVHRMTPSSKKGRTALFKAAFTSYQFKDYDGAEERFKRFQKKYRRSGLSRDAAWHLAWIDYLRGNYKEASRKFSRILKKKRRHRRLWRSFPEDKLLYWQARSYEKTGEIEKAKKTYREVLRKYSYSYYALLVNQRFGEKNTESDREIASLEIPEDEETESIGGPPIEASAEEQESEESIARAKEEKDEEDTDLAASDEETEDEKKWADIDFKSQKMSQHFLRAKNLISLGFNKDALWELYEIEKRTRNREHLKALMHYYERISAYHRSTYISQTYFTRQRVKYGIDGVQYLWKYSYPKAFPEEVQNTSKKFDLVEELPWAIMRAESNFRKEAVSPVGARGLMQLMPYTARRVGKLVDQELEKDSDLNRPEINILYGSRYLSRLMKKMKKAVPLVAASYNAGPHRVDRWLDRIGYLEMDEFIEHIPFVETRNYVKKVAKNFAFYRQVYGKDLAPLNSLTQKITVTPPEGSDFLREEW